MCVSPCDKRSDQKPKDSNMLSLKFWLTGLNVFTKLKKTARQNIPNLSYFSSMEVKVRWDWLARR